MLVFDNYGNHTIGEAVVAAVCYIGLVAQHLAGEHRVAFKAARKGPCVDAMKFRADALPFGRCQHPGIGIYD